MRLNKALIAVTLLAVVFLTGHPSAQRANRFVGGEILVKFRPGAAASAKADAHRAGGGSQAMEIPRTGLQRVRVPVGGELAAIARYQRNPNVLYAEPNFLRTLPSLAESGVPVIPGDYYFQEDWGLNNTGQQFYCFDLGAFGRLCFYSGTPDADIDAPEAWALSTGSPDVAVAVIDTGIDYTHPDLAANYAGGDDFVFFDGDPMDDHGHGTHVAGTIAAALNNATGTPATAEGVVGVAPQTRILAYKVCRSDGTCDDFAIQQAIARAITDGARVINMSLGDTAYSQSLDDAVQDAWNAGLVIVAGAGNNGTTDLFYPAALNNVISVAAFDEDHNRPSFSNYGSWVDISAPGNGILSTYPMSACGSSSTTPGRAGCYEYLTGTSMATPHVAGAAALIWSRPDVTSNTQVVDILLGSADGDGVGGTRLDSWTIHGGLNLHDALTYSVTKPVAKAGADQAVTDNDEDGVETVTLDGSASLDPNGSIVSYEWRDGSTVIGSTATAIVSLPIGVHTLTLEVTDNDGESGTDTVTVTVNPPRQITVIAPTPQATEAGASPGLLRFSRTGDTSLPLTVHYKVEGTAEASTDYQPLSGQVTIDSGSSSVDVPVIPINDALFESNETVMVTVLADAGYFIGLPFSATVTIVSDDLAPDLIVSALAAPSTGSSDTDIVVTDTTTNQGGGPSVSSSTGFYLSTDPNWDSSDVFLGSRLVPALATGASDTLATTVHLPATATGSYYVLARADWDAAVQESTEENNDRVSGLLLIGPDLIVSALTTPQTAAPGGTFSVSDTTKNQGAGSGAGSATRFYLSTNSTLDGGDVVLGSRAVPPLPAGGSDTAITSLTLPSGTAAGSYYVIAQADTANAVPESVENNNTRSSASLNIGPDLIVSALTAPDNAGAGSTFTVSETTKNQGAGNGDSSTTRFYLSTNSSLDSGDVVLASRPVPALAAGASDTATTSLTLPADTATGTYYVIAQADTANTVVETAETNNYRASFAVRVGPDLVVSALTAPATAVAGSTFSVSDTTKNQGAGNADGSTTRYYLSTNSVLDGVDVILGSRPVPPLAAGASDAATLSLTVPAGTTAGSYYVLAQADTANVVLETYESNNTRASAASVSIGPDLIVSALTAPATAGAGSTLSVSDTTKNQGPGNGDSSTTRFYLSTNSTLDGADVILGARTVPALASGASDAATTSLTVPAGTAAGTYYVIAQADDANAVAETAETNNYRASSAVRVGPDLIVSTVTAPATATAGSTFNVSETTTNQGAGNGDGSTTLFYLSTNSTLDGADVILGSRVVPPLAAGGSHSATTPLLLPAGTTAGSYYVIAQADSANVVLETTESNNTRASTATMTVGPDLIVSALTAPASGATGAAISVTDTTRNQGTGAAVPSSTGYYLSTNSTIGSGDVFLGSRPVDTLAPGGTATGSATLVIPPDTAPGFYYIVARADWGGVVAETSETNNDRASGTIKIGGDLIVASLGGSSTAMAGGAITITDTTTNSGTAPMPGSETGFYLSLNSAYDAADVFLGSRVVGPLGPSQASPASTQVVIPAGTASGNYFVIGVADWNHVVPEVNESNNTNAYGYLRVGPDVTVSAVTGPAAAVAGASITAGDTTRNVGGDTMPASVTSFYLSTNGTLDAADVFLGSRPVPSLAPGASHTGSVSLVIPVTTSAGTYYIIAKADGDNTTVEPQENNNTLLRSISITAAP